jgi:hypothetical protein
MTDDLKTHITNVLEDYKNGLLDSAEEGVEAILAHPEIRDRLKLTVIEEMR